MRLIHVAAAVLNQTPLAWEQNRSHILSAIHEARERNVTLLCLPELSITGYGCEDSFHSRSVIEQAWDSLALIIPETVGMIVSVGLPIVHRGAVYNAAALLVNGRIAGFVAKRFLAGDGIHYEPRWFKPWPEATAVKWHHQGVEYPLGDLMFDIGKSLRIGFEICEDAWVPRRPAARLASLGADFILNLSASHFAFARHDLRCRLVVESSRAFGATYIYANLLGNEAGRVIYEGDALIASCGQMLARGPRFGYRSMYLTACTIDVDATRMSHAKLASFTPAVSDQDGHVIEVDFELKPASRSLSTTTAMVTTWPSQYQKFEEFTRAVSLGLFDYLRKSRAKGFVVSLSGGADSAAVACLVALSVHFAVGELGLVEVCKQLALPELASSQALIKNLLICIYQATANSSQTTHDAAYELAQALGADFLDFNVQPLVEGYVDMVSKAMGRTLTWEHDDIALQNIQARVRSPGAWMVANLRGALLLSTSNRSEAAVGYATMDGDTSGGLSPIAGIDKAFLREWLCWLEREGPMGVGPISALAAINQQQPTAELRPLSAHQTDEEDLMPYPILDAIERLAIRDKLSPKECFLKLSEQFSQWQTDHLITFIERFFRLWSRNQWKRERYAPSFHLDDENLDPKTWCRFPILSGGFELELAELKTIANRAQ